MSLMHLLIPSMEKSHSRWPGALSLKNTDSRLSVAGRRGDRRFHGRTQVYFITWQHVKHVGGEEQGQKLALFYLQDFVVCTEYSAHFYTHTHIAPLKN